MFAFNSFIVSSIEMLLNQHVLAHPNPDIYLKPLRGKCITVDLHYKGYENPAQILSCVFSGDSRKSADILRLYSQNTKPENNETKCNLESNSGKQLSEQSGISKDNGYISDVRISITPFDLYRLMNKTITLPYENIRISGDLRLLMSFGRLLKHTGFDIEACISQLTGSHLAPFVPSTIKSLLNWGKALANHKITELNEYAKYEADALVDQHELEQIRHLIFTLTHELSILHARIDKIEKDINIRMSDSSKNSAEDTHTAHKTK